MFESLSTKLQTVFQRLTGKGRLTEGDVDAALREVRLALLEADVNFRIVKEFVAKIRERAVGEEVLGSLSPGQQVVKIVHEELVAMLGGEPVRLAHANQPPTIVMLVGLQGSGKTTTAAKLALHLRKTGGRPLLVAADVRRPAAIEQLVTLGKQLDLPVFSQESKVAPPTICANAVQWAREHESSCVVLDTAGRLHIDAEMMAEVVEIKRRLSPTEVLLVADAMTGQDAVRVGEQFHQALGLTGLILTKLDGDARGGAALSMRAVTGIPIKFVGIGEKSDALEVFYPDRMASRILGMGDVLTLIEKAQTTFDEQKARDIQKKMRDASFDLQDFLQQLQEVKKLGPLDQLLSMIPGFSSVSKQLPAGAMDGQQLRKIEAIIYSMTPEERHNPDIIDGSRRRRIARGSGTTPADINQLLNQFRQTRKLMKQLAGGRGGNLLRMLR